MTNVSILCLSFIFPAFKCCKTLPGVPIIISGFSARRGFCVLSSTWGLTSTHFTSLQHLSVRLRMTSCICLQSSLLGVSMSPFVCCCCCDCFPKRIFWIIGMAKAAVFPEPVRALIKTSLPSSKRGIVFSWIKVGSNHPSFAIAWIKNFILHQGAVG